MLHYIAPVISRCNTSMANFISEWHLPHLSYITNNDDNTTNKHIWHYPWLKQHEMCNNTTALNLWVWKYLLSGVLISYLDPVNMTSHKSHTDAAFSPCYRKDVKQQDTFALKLNKKKKGFWSRTVHIRSRPPHQLLLPLRLWSVKQMGCEK